VRFALSKIEYNINIIIFTSEASIQNILFTNDEMNEEICWSPFQKLISLMPLIITLIALLFISSVFHSI